MGALLSSPGLSKRVPKYDRLLLWPPAMDVKSLLLNSPCVPGALFRGFQAGPELKASSLSTIFYITILAPCNL